uniref:LRRCT domain-containing protein n=1 Tax=Panagrellus redivivus TaxID=6233 RepID=A0A7E4UN41_PANRE
MEVVTHAALTCTWTRSVPILTVRKLIQTGFGQIAPSYPNKNVHSIAFDCRQMRLCFLLIFGILLNVKGLVAFICPQQCQCYADPTEGEKSMHLSCRWAQINSSNLEAIRHYDSVRTLTIRCSHKSAQHVSPPPRIFARLRKLDRLEIDRCKMGKLPSDLLFGMHNLYSLIIKNADLADIPAIAFQDLKNLMSLDLSGNKLGVEPQALFRLSNLLQLDLSRNSIRYLTNVLSASNKLKVVSFSHNLIENIDFRRLPKNLTDLTIDHNRLTTLHSFAESAASLRRLDLSHNKIEFIATTGSINQLPSQLSVIDLSDNKITQIQDGAFRQMEKLSMIDLRNNELTEVVEEALEVNRTKYRTQLFLAGNPLKCICENYWMLHPQKKTSPIISDIRNVSCTHILDSTNNVSLLDADLRSGFLCKYDSNCLDGCKCCEEKQACQCYRSCPAGCFCYGSAGAHATKLGQNVVSCENVRMDRMRYVPEGVTELHLVGSMWRDKGLAQLGSKNFLTLLNLSDSSITYLNKTLLNQFPKLNVLDLSMNRLMSVHKGDVKDMKNLKILLLRDNELEDPTESVLEVFDTLEKVSLGGNHTSFDCGCGNNQTAFQTWLYKSKNREKVTDIDTVQCVHDQHGTISILRADPFTKDSVCPKPVVTTTEAPTTTTKSDMTNVTEVDENGMNDEYDDDRISTTSSTTTLAPIIELDSNDIPLDEGKSFMAPPIEPDIDIEQIDFNEDYFRRLAPNSKAIRTRAKEHTTPAPRKDFDSHILFSVLIVFLLFVVLSLIAAIISTVYYRLIRPGRYHAQKVHKVRGDEEIPLNRQ